MIQKARSASQLGMNGSCEAKSQPGGEATGNEPMKTKRGIPVSWPLRGVEGEQKARFWFCA